MFNSQTLTYEFIFNRRCKLFYTIYYADKLIGKKIEESIGSKITGLYKEYYWNVRNRKSDYRHNCQLSSKKGN